MPPFEAKDKNDFLDTVCSNVRWKQAHEAIRRDLGDHIEDQTVAFEESGMAKDDAAAMAIMEMGDPERLGLELDASYRPKNQTAMLIALAALVMMGAICRALLFDMSDGGWQRFCVALIIGGGLFALLYNLNLYRFVKWAGVIYCGAIAFVVPYRFVLEIGAGFLSGSAVFHYIFMALPVLFAGAIYSMRGKGMAGLLLTGGSLVIPLLVLLTLNNYSFAVAVAVACLFVIVIGSCHGTFGRNKWLPIAVSFLSVAGAACFAILREPYRLARLQAAIRPELYTQSTGYMGVKVKELLSGARLIGQGAETAASMHWGLAQGGAANSYMLNEFCLTVMIHRYGWLPAIAIMLVLLGFIGYGLHRALKLKSVFGRLLACAAIGMLGMQTLCYIAANLGFIFIAALPLPFIASGNMALVMDIALSGLLLSLFRSDGLYADKAPSIAKRLKVKFIWE